MNPGPRIGILGGTLDPMHVGHLQTAIAARTALDLDRVVIVPSRVPPHRSQQPVASAYHRFAMAALTIADTDGVVLSDAELAAHEGPSFTADTLERLHASGLDRSQIFFITGADAFAEIETWHRYPDVLDMAHFVVVSRPGHPVAGLAAKLPALKSRLLPAALVDSFAAQPGVFLVDARTPDVSSTEIRRRIRSGERLAGLVAPAVERHILKHQLYESTSLRADHLHGQD